MMHQMTLSVVVVALGTFPIYGNRCDCDFAIWTSKIRIGRCRPFYLRLIDVNAGGFWLKKGQGIFHPTTGDCGKGTAKTTLYDNLRLFATSCDALRHLLAIAVAFFTWKTSQISKVPDTFNFLRHVMRAIWSVRPKCSHRCVSLEETPLKPVKILKHTTKNSAEQTVMRTKWFKHIAI